MQILIILFLLLLLALALYINVRIIRWVLKFKIRIIIGVSLVGLLCVLLIVNKLFFQNMHFIQSKVYSNLYLVKYPEKDQNLIQQAILKKIKEHLKTSQKHGKKLAYTDENGIYFYEYHEAFLLSFIQNAGTAYFLENEEDLGGFVSEELGMYTQYRLAEFYFDPCKVDSKSYCGEINYFKEGEFIKKDNLKGLHLNY